MGRPRRSSSRMICGRGRDKGVRVGRLDVEVLKIWRLVEYLCLCAARNRTLRVVIWMDCILYVGWNWRRNDLITQKIDNSRPSQSIALLDTPITITVPSSGPSNFHILYRTDRTATQCVFLPASLRCREIVSRWSMEVRRLQSSFQQVILL